MGGNVLLAPQKGFFKRKTDLGRKCNHIYIWLLWVLGPDCHGKGGFLRVKAARPAAGAQGWGWRVSGAAPSLLRAAAEPCGPPAPTASAPPPLRTATAPALPRPAPARHGTSPGRHRTAPHCHCTTTARHRHHTAPPLHSTGTAPHHTGSAPGDPAVAFPCLHQGLPMARQTPWRAS